MKVVALVSGGKDSCFAMMECVKHGHEVVALANLYPADDDVDELDSFMYQTVGHQLISAYARCMGLPLFRKKIRGTTRSSALKYAETQGDEVEDLHALLHAVRQALPCVNAVCSGAIASDYQRERVENVAGRLGLTSLAYLWQRGQKGLLDEMIRSGIHAILVKVASLGLAPDKHLGRDLAAMRPILHGLSSKFGVNICGEGGEYETLTLDCPLFKHARIVLEESEVLLHSPDHVAPVGVLRPIRFRVELKGNSGEGGSRESSVRIGHEVRDAGRLSGARAEDRDGVMGQASSSSSSSSSSLLVVEVEEEREPGQVSKEEREALLEAGGVPAAAAAAVSPPAPSASPSALSPVSLGVTDPAMGQGGGGLVCISARTTTAVGDSSSTVAGHHVSAALSSVSARLAILGLSWPDVLFVQLFLSDMSSFSSANISYSEIITEYVCGEAGVPSRLCVEVPFHGCHTTGGGGGGQGTTGREDAVAAAAEGPRSTATALGFGHVAVDVLAARGGRADKKVLHVRSISGWAPCCIGPYSQCTRYRRLLLMAGQLGLHPPSMSLVQGGALPETARALRSCQAVALRLGSSLLPSPSCCICATVFLSQELGEEERRGVEEEVEGFFQGKRRTGKGGDYAGEGDEEDEEEELERDHLGIRGMTLRQQPAAPSPTSSSSSRRTSPHTAEVSPFCSPPLLLPLLQWVVVPSLPKGAAVEIAPILFVPGPMDDLEDEQQLQQQEEGEGREEEYHAMGGAGGVRASSWVTGPRPLAFGLESTSLIRDQEQGAEPADGPIAGCSPRLRTENGHKDFHKEGSLARVELDARPSTSSSSPLPLPLPPHPSGLTSLYNFQATGSLRVVLGGRSVWRSFCRAQAWVEPIAPPAASAAAADMAAPDSSTVPADELGLALRLMWQKLGQGLAESGLSGQWKNVAVVRVYFLPLKVASKDLHVLEDLTRGHKISPVFIPVAGLGYSSNATSICSLELLAYV